MDLIMIHKDLFKVAEDIAKKDKIKYGIAHCVSADLAMGAGIAKDLDERYHIKRSVDKAWPDRPRVIKEWPSCFRVGPIYSIITKERYWHKPTMDTFKAGLFKLKDMILKDDIDILIMPKIGCGLDKLDWGKVQFAIGTIFAGVDIKIIVCVKE